MNIEELRDYCLSFVGSTESLPFNNSTLVFKVMNKMFALFNIDDYKFVNLKCVPEDCECLRNENDGIFPAYHMNKKHWVSVDTSVDDELLKKLINNSYELVVQKLTKKQKEELKNIF